MKSRDINLGIWNIYFIVKIILFFNHIIEFNILRNLAFIVLLLIPIRNKILLGVRQVIAIPIGLYLLYDDSYLPPFSRLVAQTKELSTFKIGDTVSYNYRFGYVNKKQEQKYRLRTPVKNFLVSTKLKYPLKLKVLSVQLKLELKYQLQKNYILSNLETRLLISACCNLNAKAAPAGPIKLTTLVNMGRWLVGVLK